MALTPGEPLQLSESQRLFARSKYPYPAFVGGYGSGKTFTGALRAISLKSQCKGHNVGYYLPTYSLVEDIAFPQFDELLDYFQVRNRQVKGRAPYIDLPDWGGKIIFRTMDKPARIVGYQVAHSIVDELDTLPIDKARLVFNKIIARNRAKCGMRNSVGVVTTPEGYRFVYERWKKSPGKGYRLYKGKTRENARNLPTNYIGDLEDSYTAQLLAAYLDGEFVNLTAGSVYPEFDRVRNGTRETIQKDEPLHIGMDFNVTKMAAAVNVLREGDPHTVDELVNVFDTPAMIKSIKERYEGHPILVYPDASGEARKSQNASESDLALLRGAKFTVCVNAANPRVRDRVLAANSMIHKDGKRRLRVNEDKCPHLVEAFEKQAYDANGEPDKSTGLDHIIDAETYFVAYKWPVKRPVFTMNMGTAA